MDLYVHIPIFPLLQSVTNTAFPEDRKRIPECRRPGTVATQRKNDPLLHSLNSLEGNKRILEAMLVGVMRKTENNILAILQYY